MNPDADDGRLETATLGGGCFWCLEAVFDELAGVVEVESGYSGGRTANPTYREVCEGDTGHAEVIRVRFDPSAISYRDLLRVFFAIHDPTTPNRQGNDVGTQYRSVIYYHSDEQKAAAERLIDELTGERVWPARIVTEIEPAPAFYRAEDYHQRYFESNAGQPYCRLVVAPKLAKFRTAFAERRKRRD